MQNTVASGRRLAQRTLVLQALVTLTTALICLLLGTRASLGALVGGLAMTLGSGMAAWIALRGGPTGPGVVLGRLFAGIALKWVVVIGGMLLALILWKLPALAVFAGVFLSAVAFLLAARIWT